MARKEELELLLDCRTLELLMCKPDSWMYGEIQKDIKTLENKLAKQNKQFG